jgi:hypothetical protein
MLKDEIIEVILKISEKTNRKQIKNNNNEVWSLIK